MTARFDEHGDLWIEVDLSVPPEYQPLTSGIAYAASIDSRVRSGKAVTQINLTKYIETLLKASK